MYQSLGVDALGVDTTIGSGFQMSQVALTYRDYAALPDDGRRYQILDGELFVTPAPGTRHQIISMRLSAQLHAHVTAHRLGMILAAPVDVILADTSIVQPDIVFVATDRQHLVSARGIEGAPTLAVEILSPTTSDVDRRRKRDLYARHGVTCYWIVDGDARAIEMYRLAGDTYELLSRVAGDTLVAAEPFPGLALIDLWP
jgi:Uma2 family endonuclease